MGNNKKQSNRELLQLDYVRRKLQECRDECYFGMNPNDIRCFEYALFAVKPNEVENGNSFPDFVYKEGFIENFEITASKSNRKGSAQKVYDNKICGTVYKKAYELNKDSDSVKIAAFSAKEPEASYEYLCNSFKDCWEKHINSLSKYNGNKSVGVFLINYTEFSLWMHGTNKNLDEAHYRKLYGDIEYECSSPYRLSRDENLLNCIYEYHHQIRYVIFSTNDYVEIISVRDIPNIKKLLHFKYDIRELPGMSYLVALPTVKK